jgi:DNA polymerase-3 subunit alpha
MAIITLEDLDGQIDGTLFAETYAQVIAKYPDAVSNEAIVFVKGKVDKKRETPSLLVSEVIPISDSTPRLTTAIVLKLDRTKHTPEVIQQLQPLLKANKGNMPTFVQLPYNGSGQVTMKLAPDVCLKPADSVIQDIEHLLGSGSVQLIGAGNKRIKRIQQQQLFKEEAAETEVAAPTGGDEAVAEAMDPDMEEATA